jgi:prevent-host-death family protein
MQYLQFTEFRNHSKEYFDKIEHGDSYVIIRKGRPVATIMPFGEKTDGWKRAVTKVKLRSCTDSAVYVREERDES